MLKLVTVLCTVVVTMICAGPLMATLLRVVVAPGQEIALYRPVAVFEELMKFRMFFGACGGFAAAVGCYYHGYRLAHRLVIVLLPMLVCGGLIVLAKGVQVRSFSAVAASSGASAGISLRSASLYVVPAGSLVGGVVVFLAAARLKVGRAGGDEPKVEPLL